MDDDRRLCSCPSICERVVVQYIQEIVLDRLTLDHLLLPYDCSLVKEVIITQYTWWEQKVMGIFIIPRKTLFII